MSVIERSIDVDAPVRSAYDQWTQFEDFPGFMAGVEQVEQVDERTLRWTISVGGVERSFETLVEQQEPDERIVWRATEGADHVGVVTFAPLGPARTRVTLAVTWTPARLAERVADALRLVDRQAARDLDRFKHFLEARRGQPTGAWRGSIARGAPSAVPGPGTADDLATESGPDDAPELPGDLPPRRR